MTMLKIEKTVLPSPEQWEIIIEGMRNPMNSWDRMDSQTCLEMDGFEDRHINPVGVCPRPVGECPRYDGFSHDVFCIGSNDHELMTKLAKGGAVHAKYRRMIPVYVTINAPLYFYKEMDTYKIGTVCNSCSTMHKIHSKELTLDDFSTDHLTTVSLDVLDTTIGYLNFCRKWFLANEDKEGWWQMIQLLPTSYNQKRTYMFNYEVLANIYKWRRNHKLDEWHTFCDWIEELPYAELITGGADNG